jgi:hypothetical protein
MMTEKQIKRLAAETGASTRTVRRWADHESVSKVVAYALAAACRKLRIKRPSCKTRRAYKVKVAS